MSEPGRNLVVCCDGTGCVWGRSVTHVNRLARFAAKDPQRQVVFYDPGVGSVAQYSPDLGGAKPIQRLRRVWRGGARLLALAFGTGVEHDIAQAYLFLCSEYRPGDRIFLFGYSRGAFTARSVSGMVHLFGLIPSSMAALMPMLLRVYFGDRHRPSASGLTRDQLAAQVRDDFGGPHRQPWVHFVGVWDTVESVGGLTLGEQITSEPTIHDKRIRHARQALARDERRQAYQPRLYEPRTLTPSPGDPGRFTDRQGRSLAQRAFAGGHGDVGGIYPGQRLGEPAWRWIVDEARQHGLLFSEDSARPSERVERVLFDSDTRHSDAHDESLAWPAWACLPLARRRLPQVALDPSALAFERRVAQGLATRQSGVPAAWRRPGLLVGLVALLGGAAMIASLGADAGVDKAAWIGLSAAPGWMPASSLPAWRSVPLCSVIRRLLMLEWVLIAGYAAVSLYAITYAIRDLALAGRGAEGGAADIAVPRSADQCPSPALAWCQVWVMPSWWCLVLADLVENGALHGLLGTTAATQVSVWLCVTLRLATTLKWLAAGLLAVAMLRWWRVRVRVRAPRHPR